MFLPLKTFGQEYSFNTIKRIPSKIAEIHGIPYPTTKTDLMRFIDSMNFYSKIVYKLHVNKKPLYDLLLDNIKFHWNKELETQFQQINISDTKDNTLTLPNSNQPFFFTVDSYSIGLSCVLFQLIDKRKLDNNYYNSRTFTTNEQKLYYIS